MNTQIIDVSCVCMKCETPITRMVLSTRLNEVSLGNIVTCYDCQLTKIALTRKGIK
jgi:hypothetical protein